jgi:hypothetical protein
MRNSVWVGECCCDRADILKCPPAIDGRNVRHCEYEWLSCSLKMQISPKTVGISLWSYEKGERHGFRLKPITRYPNEATIPPTGQHGLAGAKTIV